MHKLKKNIYKIFITITIYIYAIEIIANPSFYIDKTEIVGISSEGVDIYLGIPYAEPPVDSLRWEVTQPKIFKTNLFKADKFAPACMQGPRIVNWYKGVAAGFGGDPNYIKTPEISEDCLYLNMWVPKNHAKQEKIPVLVYIHGGSNRAGWSFEPNYIGKNLSKKGVIVITVSYRLGVFGFYSHPNLEASNFALLDLIESLNWVKENIAKVGGDPENITISGESAGATNVAHLIASPLGKGLFNKAIHQSAGWSIAEKDLDYDIQIELSNKLSIKLIGETNKSNNLKKLRAIDSVTLLYSAEDIFGYVGYYPVIDNYSIFEPLYKSYVHGNYNHVDLIIGTNADEELMYLDKDYYLYDFYDERESWGFYTETEQLDSLTSGFINEKEKLNYLLTARNWTCPSSFIAKSLKENTNKQVWFYSFDKVRDGSKSKEMGAYHGAELPYIFNTHDDWLPTSDTDIVITNKIQNFWVNFIKTGNPNKELIEWEQYNSNAFNVLSFNTKTSMKISSSVDVCRVLGY
tara:strand:+ start:1299 stop:2855 length:1557 start_codon:yes stop_codon:yes gene_type:complete